MKVYLKKVKMAKTFLDVSDSLTYIPRHCDGCPENFN